MQAVIRLSWVQEFVEHIAEPTLEHVNLGLGDRNIIGPIVGDAHPLAVRAEKGRVGSSCPAVRRGIVGVIEQIVGKWFGDRLSRSPWRARRRSADMESSLVLVDSGALKAPELSEPWRAVGGL
ncbi:hypothetical protein [Rhizobium halophilum]|uniref:hypothetical protein n=1 Tax=Rhizobium halophilum TaxID=2846852 RepID=UPI001EFE50BE|nr:hypothetical protein [Rhizobium halophilum]MCF6367544.1 hypothetical protein [Rhizobium halophilum]